MKKISLNEELARIQEMMGVKHINPSGKDSIKELSPSDIVNSMREEEMGENDEVKDKFKDQYGKEKGEEVYYATANKQDRNPKTFEKNEEFDPSDEDGDGLSDCCGAPIVMHDICSECGEHCEAEEEYDVDEIPGFEGTRDALGDLGIRKEVDEESAIGGWDLAMESIDELQKELEEEEGSWMAMRAGKDGKVYENEEMGEARKIQQETYFETQAGALESAEEYATNKGYTVNWDSINPEHVAYGQTVSYSVELMVKEVKIKATELGIIELNKYGGFTANNYEKTFSSQSGGRTKLVTQPTDFFTNSGTGKVFTLSFDFNENTLKMYSQGEFLASFKFKSLKPGEEDDRGWFKIVGD